MCQKKAHHAEYGVVFLLRVPFSGLLRKGNHRQNRNPFWGPQIETDPTLLTDPATGAGGRRLRAGTDGRLRTRPDRGGPNGNGFAIVPRLEFQISPKLGTSPCLVPFGKCA